jgi:signal transduction histidine kinase
MRRLLNTTSFRLSLLFGVVFAGCFAILLALTYWTATAALRGQIQSQISEESQALLADAASDGTASIIQDIAERLKLDGSSAGYYILYDSGGSKIAGNLDQVPVKAGWQQLEFRDAMAAQPVSLADEDHELWGLGSALPGGGFLFVGQDAFRVLTAQEAVIESFAWSASIAFLLAALAGVVLSQGFLRRIDAINRTSQSIIGGKLKERIPVRGTSDEIDKLSMNLNRLFDSNQSLLESLRQVSSDIAHDLRTPLSRLRQGLEEARMRASDVKSYEQAVDGAIVESDHLLATFAALLRIAQIESGSRKAGFKDMDLSLVFDRVADAYRAVAEDADKSISVAITPGVKHHGDAELLLQMTANLLENAIRHTPPGTQITVSLESRATGARAVVADSGPGIPAELRDKVFQRFYRLDASRGSAGNGLGLALVSAIAGLHGIAISLEDSGPGLRVVLDFPVDQ